MIWTKLHNRHPIWMFAENQYVGDDRRVYHGWGHIGRGYYHAAKTFGFDYDLNLDIAWLMHDVVYDEFPDKELRSIEWFHDAYSNYSDTLLDGVDPDKVESLVASTIDHSSTDDDRLIMMDLADLTSKHHTVLNFEALKEEAYRLYGASEKQFAEGTYDFMTKMRVRIMKNAKGENGPFWALVLRGIDQTLEMSEDILISD